jgi:acyl-CoA thioesterase YciA
MRSDANPLDEMFVGQVMHLMDLAVDIAVAPRYQGTHRNRIRIEFGVCAVFNFGDVVCVYSDITKTGQTSIAV